ncbi:MAG: hypothetical protein J7M29_12920 [Verrucomicrobia bacterium]|nr:hypothetical protein [Verrucomicrobiota bacterium]
MNAKLVAKTVFLIVLLLALVLIGLNNKGAVPLVLPPLFPHGVKLPAAIMYFAFFAVGLLTGTLIAGGKK